MSWEKSAADRRRDAQVYGSPEYRRNRELARRRAGGRCEQCGHAHPKLECDHVVPKSQGGGNALSNLRMLCPSCHQAKSLAEGSGWRKSGGRAAADPEPRPRTAWLARPGTVPRPIGRQSPPPLGGGSVKDAVFLSPGPRELRPQATKDRIPPRRTGGRARASDTAPAAA